MKNFLHRLLLKFVASVTSTMGKIHLPFTHKNISSKDYRALQPLLLPGQTLLSYMNGELAGIFMPGEYSHVAIVKDKFTVIEATTHGVIETDLIDFMMKKDRVACLNPLFATQEEMKEAVVVAQAQIGKPYKFDMEFSESNVKSFYCSELVYYSYMKACHESPFVLRSILGVQTVAPSDFILATDKFQVVWKK